MSRFVPFLLLLAAVLLPRAISGQNAWPAEPVQQLHVKVVRAERTARFFSAWEEASAVRRALAEELLVAEKRPGASDGRRPELSSIAAATRVLRGADPDAARADGQQRFADALDLQVVPGAFTGRPEEEDGEPLTVRFYRMYDVKFREDVEFSLYWIGPDGTEVRARTEQVAARFFDPPGQVMYVRAPRTAAGVWWHLVPEVVHAGRATRGVGVPVFSGGLSAGASALRDTWDPPELTELREGGFRAASFSLAPGASTHPRGAWPAPLVDVLPGAASADATPLRLRWSPGLDEDPQGERVVLLVVAPTGECAETIFLGPVGRAWAELTKSPGVVVCAVEHERKNDEALRELVRDWKRAFAPEEDVRVIVVARGDAVASLPFVFRGDDVPVDGFVLCADRSGRPRALPRVPTLVFRSVPFTDEPAADETRVHDPAPPFLREPGLPGRIAAWLAAARDG